MRGALEDYQWLAVRLRIIPAYAGSTTFYCNVGSFYKDHPRVCGEHRLPLVGLSQSQGSSPRMRGARTCPFGQCCFEGSSPRMRGARLRMRWMASPEGIIPAYAGSTDLSVVYGSIDTDHPRVCGEHIGQADTARWQSGSSPRMRGARQSAYKGISWERIIPAYAGSTYHCLSGLSTGADHPRVCGEHLYCQPGSASAVGSSPRMRGAHDRDGGRRISVRIIPAYAGST